MTQIIVSDATFSRFDAEQAVAARHGAQFREARCKTPEDVLQAASGADVLVVQFCRITREAIECLPAGGAIVRYGLGLDNIDVKAAQRRGIRVAYVPDYATGEVADHTATLILSALRKILPLDASVRSGKWDPIGTSKPLPSFGRAIVGFVGFGRIGREVHARLKPFGFQSVVHDPYVDPSLFRDLGARAVDLDELFESADLVTLHAPLSDASRHLVNGRRLSLMKPTAVIVNTARGALIDTEALVQALQSGRLGGAALDVFEQEPLPPDAPLRHCPSVILTPHAAWYSDHSVERVQMLAADEIDRHLSGREARCPAPEV